MSKTHNRILYLILAMLLIVILLTAYNVYVATSQKLEISTEVQSPPAFDINNQIVNVNVNTDVREQVDLNRSTLEDLKSLPGIGEVLAQRIIESRPFYSVDQLKDVKGIGDKIYDNIRGLVTVVRYDN